MVCLYTSWQLKMRLPNRVRRKGIIICACYALLQKPQLTASSFCSHNQPNQSSGPQPILSDPMPPPRHIDAAS